MNSPVVALCIGIAAALSAMPALAFDTCEKLTGTRAMSSHVEVESFVDCKAHPVNPNNAIFVTAEYQKGSSFTSPLDNSTGLYDLTLVLVRSGDGRTLKQRRYKR